MTVMFVKFIILSCHFQFNCRSLRSHRDTGSLLCFLKYCRRAFGRKGVYGAFNNLFTIDLEAFKYLQCKEKEVESH